MESQTKTTRRSVLKNTAAVCTAITLGGVEIPAQAESAQPADFGDQLRKAVYDTLFIDTHEHLLEEEERLKANAGRIKANDWSFLLSHYLDSDLLTAGMPKETHEAFFSSQTDPIKKWDLLEPFWPYVRNTGYGQAVEIAMQKIYGVSSLSRENVPKIQEQYLKQIQPGFYMNILRNIAGIESCQVNCLSAPFSETKQPNAVDARP